ncbi:MAG: hypothetical protein JW953_16130 [Anaerolineae bacterium]|nr:hypothetical protein [Anaerolineae bacterium]
MLLRKLLFLTIVLIILSPLVYFGTGIGQRASTLSPAPVALAGGTLQSSPKAEALHSLSLSIRVERLLIYPILLFLMQYSGLAVKLRAWLTDKWLPPIRRVPGFKWLDQRLARLTRNRLSLADVLIIGLYLTLFSLGLSLIYFPFSIYSGFVLRHQFGLSTQTLAAWLRDFGIGWVVNWMTTLITFGGFYLLLKLAPRRWPIWAGLGFTLFTFGYIVLEPIVVSRCFTRFRRSPTPTCNIASKQWPTGPAWLLTTSLSLTPATKPPPSTLTSPAMEGPAKSLSGTRCCKNTLPMRWRW